MLNFRLSIIYFLKFQTLPDLSQALTQGLPIKRTGSLDTQTDIKKARHTSGAVGSPDSQGSRTSESNKPIEKMYCDAVVNFLLKIACQVLP